MVYGPGPAGTHGVSWEMKILLKTAGLLGRYLPPGSGRNAAQLTIPADSTPLDVIKRLGMPLEETYLVSLNGTVVTRNQRDSVTLSDDDHLAIMPALKGG